jgi:Uma2 family endonuclease
MNGLPAISARSQPALVLVCEKQPSVTVPAWVVDLASFRRWARSSQFPEQGNLTYLAGALWVDLTLERVWHNALKTELTGCLGMMRRQHDLGLLYSGNMRLTNLVADLSSEPDLLFFTHETLQEGRVLLTEGDEELEVEGTPDLVVEIVSPSSVGKDTKLLRKLYWQAGIQEYWLIEMTEAGVRFTLLQRGSKGYVASRGRDGWLKSAVFASSFRLTRTTDQHGLFRFRLEVS